ncbi:unnamed protein product, partial [Heterosigma akashiwo]
QDELLRVLREPLVGGLPRGHPGLDPAGHRDLRHGLPGLLGGDELSGGGPHLAGEFGPAVGPAQRVGAAA